MENLAVKFQRKLDYFKKKAHEKEALAFAVAYTKENGLDRLIDSRNVRG